MQNHAEICYFAICNLKSTIILVVHPSSKPVEKEIITEKDSGYQRHMQVSTYRCFLPDLTGFVDLHCIGPEPSGIHDDQIFSAGLLSWEFSPARADCRYRAPLAPRLARPISV